MPLIYLNFTDVLATLVGRLDRAMLGQLGAIGSQWVAVTIVRSYEVDALLSLLPIGALITPVGAINTLIIRPLHGYKYNRLRVQQ